MRLAYFTPLPPGKSGIADYNSELLPYLAKGAEISVFVADADELRGNRDHEGFSVHNAYAASNLEGLTGDIPVEVIPHHLSPRAYEVEGMDKIESREYTPADVRAALEAAGFKVLKLFAENVWHKTDEEFLAWLDRTDVPREPRGDNIYAVGRKQSMIMWNGP